MKSNYVLVIICFVLLLAILLFLPCSEKELNKKPQIQNVISAPKYSIYDRVENVELTNGVLKFTTANSGGRYFHCIQLRNKNFILSESGELESDSIKIVDLEHDILEITFPLTMNIDFESFVKKLP